MQNSSVKQNLEFIKRRIAIAVHNSNRNPSEVKLLLATKTVPAEKILEAVQLGQTLIGENKVQELRDKKDLLQNFELERHFIGHLQSNKVKDVLKYVSCVQSVDRFSIAQALHDQLEKREKSLDIMVQVNTSFEESKFGISPDEAVKFIKSLSVFPTLNIVGLMTIGLFSADAEKVRPSFRLLRQIKEEVIAKKLLDPTKFLHLSMGMSADLETAIAEGATIVRVGTAIFGERIYPDGYYWNEGDSRIIQP